jgi:hypothetical protein
MDFSSICVTICHQNIFFPPPWNVSRSNLKISFYTASSDGTQKNTKPLIFVLQEDTSPHRHTNHEKQTAYPVARALSSGQRGSPAKIVTSW